MENISVIISYRKFIISILSELNSATFNKNVLSAYNMTGIGETAVNKRDSKRIPVFMEFLI